MSARFGLALGVVFALLVVAGSPSGAAAQVGLAPFDCSQAGFPAGTPAAVATCEWITLPEDSAAPDSGRVVRVAVAVVHAADTPHAPDPIVLLQGGPGEPIVKDAAMTPVAFGAAAKTRDILVIDQRGTGLSQPGLGCPEIDVFSTNQASASVADDAYENAFLDTLSTCVERLRGSNDIDLTTYTSAQNAADVMGVVHALGYQQVNLYGLSYGARLALTIIRQDSNIGEVRSAVLGGVYGPEADALQVPVGLAERLDSIFDACAADATCNATYGDLRASLHALVTSPQRTVVLEGLLDALGSSDGISSVPKLVSSAAAVDGTLAANGLRARQQELTSLAWGMNVAMQCQEEFLLIPPDQQASDAAAVRPGYEGLALRFPESSQAMPAWCAQHNFSPVADANAKSTVSSDDVPVLAISGRFDPFTPPEWADRATAGFASRYLVTLQSAGHDTALASACPIDIISAFLTDPHKAPDASCAEAPVQFASYGN